MDYSDGYYSMEQIDLEQVAADLEALGADRSTTELVLNNVRMYNKLVFDYEILGIQKNLYLTYQLNVQISKQMLDLKKLNKPKDEGKEEEGGLMDLVKSMKQDSKPKKNKKPNA